MKPWSKLGKETNEAMMTSYAEDIYLMVRKTYSLMVTNFMNPLSSYGIVYKTNICREC